MRIQAATNPTIQDDKTVQAPVKIDFSKPLRDIQAALDKADTVKEDDLAVEGGTVQTFDKAAFTTFAKSQGYDLDKDKSLQAIYDRVQKTAIYAYPEKSKYKDPINHWRAAEFFKLAYTAELAAKAKEKADGAVNKAAAVKPADTSKTAAAESTGSNEVLKFWKDVNAYNPKNDPETINNLAKTSMDLSQASVAEFKSYFNDDKREGRWVTRYGKRYKVFSQDQAKAALGPSSFNAELFNELGNGKDISARGLVTLLLRQSGLSKDELAKGTAGKVYSFNQIFSSIEDKKYQAQTSDAKTWIESQIRKFIEQQDKATTDTTNPLPKVAAAPKPAAVADSKK